MWIRAIGVCVGLVCWASVGLAQDAKKASFYNFDHIVVQGEATKKKPKTQCTKTTCTKKDNPKGQPLTLPTKSTSDDPS